MKNIKTINDLKRTLRLKESTLGLVPTMGALHQGHLELIKKSLDNNEQTIVSIFVNPTQFNEKQDFNLYPRDLDADFKLLEELGVDFVFTPTEEELYQDGYRYRVCETDFSKKLCGRERVGHFDGVLTIILKLINLTKATNVYFGEKDYQQFKLIQDMVDAFFMDANIIAVPTIREESGLAMSSRNLLLSPEAKNKSSQIYKSLKSRDEIEKIYESLTKDGFDIDYLEEIEKRRFIAARIENVRLIDNVEF